MSHETLYVHVHNHFILILNMQALGFKLLILNMQAFGFKLLILNMQALCFKPCNIQGHTYVVVLIDFVLEPNFCAV